MKNKLIVLSGFVLSLAPAVALAAGIGDEGIACADVTAKTIGSVLCKIGEILNSVVPVLIVLGVVYFVWGVVTYVIASDEEAKKSGKMRMIYGILGLAIIVAMWGVVAILTNTFGLTGSNEGAIILPTLGF